MEEKHTKKISLLFILFMISIIVIIIMGFFIYKLSYEKSEESKKTSELESQVNSLNQSLANLKEENNNLSKKDKTNNSKSNDEDINYIEFNEKNFNKYSPSKVYSITDNDDGTYTIIAKVYEEAKLPKLSEEEVELLNDGKTIDILDWTFKKIDENDSTDDTFVIESTDEEDWMKFYVSTNEDGTATLNVYGQVHVVKPTNTYLKTVVDESVLGEDVTEWKDNYSPKSEYTFITTTMNYTFEDGKISHMEWNNI